MVKEARIIFSLGDILQVRVICLKCKGEIARSLSQNARDLPWQCPNCLDEWWDQLERPAVINATLGRCAAFMSSMRPSSQITNRLQSASRLRETPNAKPLTSWHRPTIRAGTSRKAVPGSASNENPTDSCRHFWSHEGSLP